MEIKGVGAVVKELRALGGNIEKMIDAETKAAAFSIEKDAKIYAPKNFGKLAQSISHAKIKESNYKITVNETYGAYLEFGTGSTKVKVPPEFEETARSFMGKKTGTFADFIKAMTLYFEAKGYDTKYVWIACINQLNEGMNPRPFLYPAWVKGKKEYVENLKKVLSKVTRKVESV